jgi:hypothetical protein
MKVLKYIINKDKVPILFNTFIEQCDLFVPIVSAGFVIVTYDKDTNQFFAKCFGESVSIEIGSKYSSERIIEDFLNNLFL